MSIILCCVFGCLKIYFWLVNKPNGKGCNFKCMKVELEMMRIFLIYCFTFYCFVRYFFAIISQKILFRFVSSSDTARESSIINYWMNEWIQHKLFLVKDKRSRKIHEKLKRILIFYIFWWSTIAVDLICTAENIWQWYNVQYLRCDARRLKGILGHLITTCTHYLGRREAQAGFERGSSGVRGFLSST